MVEARAAFRYQFRAPRYYLRSETHARMYKELEGFQRQGSRAPASDPLGRATLFHTMAEELR